jgi:hypothetical protein
MSITDIEQLTNDISAGKKRIAAAEHQKNRLERDLANTRSAIVKEQETLETETKRLRQNEEALDRARSTGRNVQVELIYCPDCGGLDCECPEDPEAEAAADAREGQYTAWEIIEGGS